jgi:hypothetical protein
MSLPAYNVTIDPWAPATPVGDPEIEEIIDLDEGIIRNAQTFISAHRYDALVAQRLRIREALKELKPLYSCPLCSTPVYLVANPEKRFFFRHVVEDGSCPAQTRTHLTEAQIRARKYHGLRESQAHTRIKWLIERSLHADPAFTNTTIMQERRWRSAGDPSRWRQPDVQAMRGAQRFAFEAQLSTTFLDVVVERRLFYKAEGALLIWIMGSFDPGYRRMTTDDLLFSNNSNILLVDDETTRLSEERREFHIRCLHRRCYREANQIGERWDDTVARFAELTCDVASQRAYLFDFEAEERKLEEVLAAELRVDFFDFWGTMQPHFDGRSESLARWHSLRSRLAAHGISVPDNPSGDSSFRPMIHSVLSAVRGVPVGWHFKKLIEVAHHLAIDHPQHLLAFGFAIESAGNKGVLRAQDGTGKWSRKREDIWRRIQKGESSFLPDQRWLPALSFLFPDVGARVNAFLAGEDS